MYRLADIKPETRRALASQELIERVLGFINERTMLMDEVAAWKWLHHLPVVDSSREEAILQHVSLEADALGLAAGPVCSVFEVQIRCARAIQEQLYDRWRRYGFDHNLLVASLNETLRVRIDRLAQTLMRAMWVAVPALSAAAFMMLARPIAARVLGVGWSEPRTTDLLRALGGVRAKSSAGGAGES